MSTKVKELPRIADVKSRVDPNCLVCNPGSKKIPEWKIWQRALTHPGYTPWIS
jgi:hypothetical protein